MSHQPLSGTDAAWLHMDRATNRMVIAGFFQLSNRVTRSEIARLYSDRLMCFPRFAERVVEPSGFAGLPRWERDPDFDIDRHVIAGRLPPGANEATLRATFEALLATPLDLSHPLWQTHVFENYPGGTIVFHRIHHCVADGFALFSVLLSLCESPSAEMLEARTPLRPRFIAAVREVLANPYRLPALMERSAQYALSAARLLFLPPDPPSPLRGPLGVDKHVAWTRPIPIEQVRSIAKATGTTVNDVLTAAVTGALRTHLVRLGHEPGRPLHAMVPVNLRGSEAVEDLGNVFGLVVPALPIRIADPFERLEAVHRMMMRLKKSPEALVGMAIVKVMGWLPRVIEASGVTFFASKTTLVLTNVPGPRRPLTLAGSTIRAMQFWVPQSGSLGLGVSISSYAGAVTMGVLADAMRLPDPTAFVRDIEAEVAALCDAAGVQRVVKRHATKTQPISPIAHAPVRA